MDRYPYHYKAEACRERVHWRCGGEERDAGDGTTVRCECSCHDGGPEAAYDTQEEARDGNS